MTEHHHCDTEKRPEAINSQYFLYHMGNICQCIDNVFIAMEHKIVVLFIYTFNLIKHFKNGKEYNAE